MRRPQEPTLVKVLTPREARREVAVFLLLIVPGVYLAVAFAGLTLIAGSEVWRGFPAAITRVALPLTFGFNVLLASRERRFWHWYLPGNVHLVPAYFILF